MDIADILTELSDHGFEDTTDAEKLNCINDTLWDIESRELWPFLEKTILLNFDGSSATPTNVPADFKAVMWMFDNTQGVSLWPERLSTIRNRAAANLSQVSDPSWYYFVGSQIRFWPTPPASTGRYQMDYVATQQAVNASSVAANILLPARHHRAIVLGTLWRLYKKEDDPDNGNMFQIDYENRIQQMREDLFRRQYQRADQIFVIDEDDEYFL